MKRTDLTKETLEYISKNLQHDIKLKIDTLMHFLGIEASEASKASSRLPLITRLFNYASLNFTGDKAYNPDDDIKELINILFSPNAGINVAPSVPTDFWQTPTGYVCEVAMARSTLDKSMPLTVVELAILADRKFTTVQQHCQRGSIKATKEGKVWKIKSDDALKYLETVNVQG